MADETVSTLNDLIETLKNGQEGFTSAAGNVTDARVKAAFDQFSRQRAQFASELQGEVRRLGGDPETTGSAVAAAHRGWINLKSALGGGEKAILEEAERGEDVAVKSYEKALTKLPPDAAGVVQRQYGEVKRAHDQVKSLRDSWK